MQKLLCLVIGLIFTATVAIQFIPAKAHMGATGVVKERMEAMKAIAGALKVIKREISQGEEYSATEVKRQADLIKSYSGQAMTKLFPDGSSGGVSEAKLQIWSLWSDFQNKADDLEKASTALGSASIPKKVPNKEFANVAKACGSCHKTFREKK